MKKIIGIFVVLIVLFSGCTNRTSTQAPVTTVATTAPTTTMVTVAPTTVVETTQPLNKPYVSVSDNPAGDIILVDDVYLDEKGFIVVHPLKDGKVEGTVGVSELLIGQHSNVKIAVSDVDVPSQLIAMLYYDNGDGVYDFPGSDTPVKIGENVVIYLFNFGKDDSEPAPSTEESATMIKTQPVREFDMTAKRYSFNPSTIRVNQGDLVRITVESTDVSHGIAIREYDINVELPPGQTKIIEFTADKKGTFNFYCSVFCGSGHSRMTGTLIVE